jgi:hypothetical protein
MATQSKRLILSALALASSLLACDRLDIDADLAVDTATPTPALPVVPAQVATVSPEAAPAESVAKPAPSPRPTPKPKQQGAEEPAGDSVEPDARDFERVRRAAEAFAARSLYLHWRPDPLDDGNARICYGSEDEGHLPSAAWGLARARVVDLTFDDGTNERATAQIEVVRVLTVKGDPETSEGNYARLDMMVVKPVLDTMDVKFRRREQGEWVQCALYNRSSFIDPISLTGPPADTLIPRGVKLTRIVPAGATWQRVRELADSVGRG